MQCAIASTILAPQNAADVWNEFFSQIEEIEIPFDYEEGWTQKHQGIYEELSPLIKRAREIAAIPHCMIVASTMHDMMAENFPISK